MSTMNAHEFLYLEEGTPVLREPLTDFAAWQQRTAEEKDELNLTMHNAVVGEDWNEEDTWGDVSFSPQEIQQFSAHILVEGDNCLPEWYQKSPSQAKSALDNTTQNPVEQA